MDSLPRTTSLRRLYSTSSGAAPRPPSRRVDSDGGSAGAGGDATGSLHPALRPKKQGQSLADAGAQAEFMSKRWVWVPDAVAGYIAAYVVEGASADDETVTVSCLDDKASYCNAAALAFECIQTRSDPCLPWRIQSRTVSTADLSKMNPPKVFHDDVYTLQNTSDWPPAITYSSAWSRTLLV
jgi:hypothetical protein